MRVRGVPEQCRQPSVVFVSTLIQVRIRLVSESLVCALLAEFAGAEGPQGWMWQVTGDYVTAKINLQPSETAQALQAALISGGPLPQPPLVPDVAAGHLEGLDAAQQQQLRLLYGQPWLRLRERQQLAALRMDLQQQQQQHGRGSGGRPPATSRRAWAWAAAAWCWGASRRA